MIPISPYYNRGVGEGLQRDNHGDVVANTLQYYRERMKSNDISAPKPYKDIKNKLQKTIEEGKLVLIDIKDSYSVQTVIVKFEYVSDRWAMGKSICYLDNQEVMVPYTIHFSDIYCKLLRVKVIAEGESPFAKS